MAITIKEINVRTTIVQGNKKETEITPEMLRSIKEDIIRELKGTLTEKQSRKER